MKLYNKIGGGAAIVSFATVIGGGVNALYQTIKRDSYLDKIQLLENYSEKPDQNKLAELRHEVADANTEANVSMLVMGGAVIPTIGGMMLGFYVPGRRRKSKLESQAASS